MKVMQEFYCRHCPADEVGSKDPLKGRTGGHFRIKLSLGYEATILLNCPNCGHEHTRHVKNGEIFDGQHPTTKFEEKVRVPKAAWSRLPQSREAAEARAAKPGDHFLASLRKGAVIRTDADLTPEAIAARPAAAGGAGWLELYSPPSEEKEAHS